jgi:hypothetical protein
MSARVANLDVRVRLLADPCLWCWEIIDRDRHGVVVESSWACDWTADESPGDALAVGRVRLAELGLADGESAGRGPHRKRASAA